MEKASIITMVIITELIISRRLPILIPFLELNKVRAIPSLLNKKYY